MLECLGWNNGSQLAVQRQRWSTAVANTFTHDGYGWTNARRRKCKRVWDAGRSRLSAV